MLQISAIPACIGNYIWIFHTDDSPRVWVLDPGDSQLVKDWLQKNDKELAGIFITHHHWDHVDGIEDLITEGLAIAGPAKEPFKYTNIFLREGDTLDIGWLEFKVMELEGHTQHHIAYFFDPENIDAQSASRDIGLANSPPMFFCGDILFSAGCGRLKQGTADQLHHSLNRISKELPEDTLVYCGHEYTLDNLRFALTVEPSNQDSRAYQEKCARLVKSGLRTVPSTMATEKRINPFLRCDSPEIRKSCENKFGKKLQNSQECFAALRKWKDNFA